MAAGIEQYYCTDRVPGKGVDEKTLPEFLKQRLPENASHAIFFQVLYPQSCATHSSGDYASRYTLFRSHVKGQGKTVVRPFSMRRMHVHGMLGTSPEWKAAHLSHPGPNSVKFSIEEALLKHIRPDRSVAGNNTEHFYPCKFGKELDPKGHMGVE